MLQRAGGQQAAGLVQRLDDDGAGFPDIEAAKQGQLVHVAAVRLHGVEDVVRAHAVGQAGLVVVHAVGGRGVDDAGAVAVADVVGQIHGRQAPVAVGAAARVGRVMQRVAEGQPGQRLAFGGGDDVALQAVALQRLLCQLAAQQEHAARGADQRVFQIGVGVERLVGGQCPGRGGPDDGVGGAGQAVQAKGGGQRLRVVGLKGHIQRAALLVLVFDFKLGQRRRAVKAPIHGLEAAIDKAALDHALEGAQLVGFVAEVHGQVGVVPVAQHAQALEVLLLLGDLRRGVGAALGLHFVAAQLAAKLFFHRVFNGQAVAVPAGHVLRVKAIEHARLVDHVFQNLVDGMAHVKLAVGVGRAVVQHEFGVAAARGAQALVQAAAFFAAFPAGDPARLAFGQFAPHGKRRVGQVQGVAVALGLACLLAVVAHGGVSQVFSGLKGPPAPAAQARAAIKK